MKIQSLRDLLIVKIQRLYDIENQLTKALPKMAKNATDGELRAALTAHLEETKKQKERLESVFEMLEEKPKKAKAEGLRGLIEDGEWLMDQGMSDEVNDAAIIASGLSVEHYEMAEYDAAITWAETLVLPEVAAVLDEIRAEEENAATKLMTLAEGTVNPHAGALDETEEDDTGII